MKRLLSTLIVAFLVVLGTGLARDYGSLHRSSGAHAGLDPAFPADKFPLGNSSERIAERLQVYLGSPTKSTPKKRVRLAQAATPVKSDGQTDDLLIEAEKMLGPEGSQSNAKNAKPKSEEPASTETASKKSDGGEQALSAGEQHLALFVENRYPAAATCGICHPKHYKEWSVSQHAYAQLSPIYLSLNNKINELSNGSNGDFCLRCHNPVGANLGESTFESNLDRHPTSREGITCVVCHRINMNYNKVSGRLALVEGGLTEPVLGPKGNVGVKEVLDQPQKFRVVTNPEEPGRKIHNEARVFDPIKSSRNAVAKTPAIVDTWRRTVAGLAVCADRRSPQATATWREAARLCSAGAGSATRAKLDAMLSPASGSVWHTG